MKRFLLMFALAAMTLAGSDLTGKWSGSIQFNHDGETKDDVAYMVLKQSGEDVTGTVGPAADKQWELKNGKIRDGKVTFDVVSPEGPTVKFNLEFDGERLKGDANGEHDGRKFSAKLDMKRAE